MSLYQSAREYLETSRQLAKNLPSVSPLKGKVESLHAECAQLVQALCPHIVLEPVREIDRFEQLKCQDCMLTYWHCLKCKQRYEAPPIACDSCKAQELRQARPSRLNGAATNS